MRLGISSYTYGWAVGNRLGALDLIGRAVELGVGVLQICDNLPEETWGEGSVEAIAARATAAAVSMEVGARGTEPGYLRRMIGVARRLRSGILRVVVDAAGDRPEPEEVVRRIREVGKELEAAGVTLAIENHDRFPARVLAGVVEALRGVRVGICLDTVNSFGALEGPEVVAETLGPYVVNLHLKDFEVRRFPHLQGFTVEGRPVGRGMLDVPWLLGKLKELGRDPNAIVELWTPPEGSLVETIAKEAEWAVESVRAARQWIKD